MLSVLSLVLQVHLQSLLALLFVLLLLFVALLSLLERLQLIQLLPFTFMPQRRLPLPFVFGLLPRLSSFPLLTFPVLLLQLAPALTLYVLFHVGLPQAPFSPSRLQPLLLLSLFFLFQPSQLLPLPPSFP